ncbi:hypothetical protein ACA910_007098 [Epithemia clementina (nom. ined.)]
MQNHLSKLFKELEQCAAEGVRELFGWEPIRLVMNADMSAVWKMNQFGGAMKHDEHPCYCCNITNDNMAVPNDDKDDCRWCRLMGLHNDKEKKCYHYKMLMEEVLELMDADLKKLEQVLKGMIDNVYEVCKKSKILRAENPRFTNLQRATCHQSTLLLINTPLDKSGRSTMQNSCTIWTLEVWILRPVQFAIDRTVFGFG